jgi:heme/copper-type cytochrome/quinol oxidase subunit 4
MAVRREAAEGVSAAEIAKELREHRAEVAEAQGRDRMVAIVEAVLLSVVAVLAALAGYSAARWGTHSSVSLANAATVRTEASRTALKGLQVRTFDSVSFNAAFGALVAGDDDALRVAVRRLRPGYRPVFSAWLATHPMTNRNAPPGPAYLPQYRIPEEARARALDARSDRFLEEGRRAAETADKYVRLTVLLAVVLFLVGISSHFPVRAARYGFVVIGAIFIAIALAEFLSLGRAPD